ncbi:MAG TPA: DUF3592 domain-containing protein [Acidimicrobiales bacterium]
MTGADRPDAVRRWVRNPLWWGLAALAFAGALFVADVVEAQRRDRRFDRGLRVTGTITAGWASGQDVEVVYRHPQTGEEVSATTVVWNADRLPDSAGPIPLEVSRSDPTDVVLAGDRVPATANLLEYLPWTLLPMVIWAVRVRTVRATEALMASSAVRYAMLAAASPPGRWGLRWRLHLYPADAGAGTPPVCTIPLVDRASRGATFPVEVKGSPRPFGRVVARRQDDGTELWPSGRALRTVGSAPTASSTTAATAAGPPAPSARGRWLIVAGAVVFVAGIALAGIGTYAGDVRGRQRLVAATATASRPAEDGRVDVSVTYEWAGETLSGTVTQGKAPDDGAALTVRVDPQSPTRVWSTTQERPPGTTEGTLAGFGIFAGLALVVAGGILRHNPGG